jgi:hypothetical protein
VVSLRSFTHARHIYGDVPDESTALQIHQALLGVLDGMLEGETLPGIAWPDQRPHFENTADTTLLSNVAGALLIFLSGELNCGVDELDKVTAFAREKASATVQGIQSRLQELLVFDCRFPLPRAGAQYGSRERALFMVGQYWGFYRELLQQHGGAMIMFSPHPLLRFIVNAKARIKHYLEAIEDSALRSHMDEALDVSFDQDTNMAWEEWTLPIVARASEAYEEARLAIPSTSFALTEAEHLFLGSGRASLAELEKSSETEMGKLMANVARTQTAGGPEAAATGPKTCHEMIGEVERALRDIVVTEAKQRRGDHWLAEVERLLGDGVVEARATMLQRKVTNPEEIIYFTNLTDVCLVISQNFNLYAPRVGMTRREFNTKTARIVKGRTEEAHNRPEHLWPEIEQQRVRVDCHDLLGSIGHAQRR